MYVFDKYFAGSELKFHACKRFDMKISNEESLFRSYLQIRFSLVYFEKTRKICDINKNWNFFHKYV